MTTTQDQTMNTTNSDQNNLSTTTTLFISKLPKTLTSEDLLNLASSIGPVRKAFIVKSKSPSNQSQSNHPNTQIGYVRYVIRSDAEQAIKIGFDLNPKPSITWAKPRPSMKERRMMNNNNTTTTIDLTTQPDLDTEESNTFKNHNHNQNQPIQNEIIEIIDEPVSSNQSQSNPSHQLQSNPKANSSNQLQSNHDPNSSNQLQSKPKPNHQPQTSYKRDPTANRTVVLQGLPLPPSSSTPQETQAYEQSMIKALYKRARKLGQLESVIYPAPLPFTKTSQLPSTAHAHLTFYDPTIASRVCKRLHLHIFKSHLITTCMKARMMSNSKLGPKHSGGRLVIRNLGFEITEDDLRYSFGKFGEIQSIELPKDSTGQKSKGFGFVWMMNYVDAQKAMEALNGTELVHGIVRDLIEVEKDGEKKSLKRKREKEVPKPRKVGRVIAVDWALGKKQFLEAEEMEAKGGEEENEDGSEEDEEDEDEDEGDEDEDEDEEEDEDGEDEEERDSESDELDDSESEEHSNSDHTKPSSTEGITLFIRNLSFEATEDELYGTFRSFGPLNYARIVMDPKTQRSRGTGFVCMKNKSDGIKVLQIAKGLENEGLGQGPLAANGLPSLLQPDPSSGLASQLSLHGRVLGVSEAVTKHEAERLRIERDQKGVGKDKRNLYLMKEGLILPGNPSHSNQFDPSDLTARQSSFDERKSLLRTNLSLYISKTRLSIRQMPSYVSNRTLKKLARFCLKEWRSEVKLKKREEIRVEELEEKVGKEKDEKASKIKQVKVVIDQENKGKSKGYGFMELFEHADALRIVRYVCENLVRIDELLKVWTLEELEGEECRKKSSAQGEEDGKEKEKEREKEKEKRRKKVEEIKKLLKEGKRSQKLLMVEFAIENAQTVKKRNERSEKLIERQKMKLAITAEKPSSLTETRNGKGSIKGGNENENRFKKKKMVEKMKRIEDEQGGGDVKGLRIKSLIGKKRKIRREKNHGK